MFVWVISVSCDIFWVTTLKKCRLCDYFENVIVWERVQRQKGACFLLMFCLFLFSFENAIWTLFTYPGFSEAEVVVGKLMVSGNYNNQIFRVPIWPKIWINIHDSISMTFQKRKTYRETDCVCRRVRHTHTAALVC